MKRNSLITFIVLAAVAFLIAAYSRIPQTGKAQSASTTVAPAQSKPSQQAPEGATVTKKSASARAGYHFVKQGNNDVALVKNDGGGTTGKFSCTCDPDSKAKGSCDTVTTKDSLECSGHCSDCRLKVRINGNGSGTVQQ